MEVPVATQRFVGEEVVPRLRGLSHAYAFWVALTAGIVLVAVAPGERARLAAGIYAVGLCALFGGSGLYHRWPGSPRFKPLLRRVDHSAIFVFIAASCTPIALLVLSGGLRTAVLVAVWAGAAAGVAFSLVWIDAPRVLGAACYLALGWAGIAALPQLLRHAGLAPAVLFIVGGALYSLGATVYALRRPNPWPRTFGFHEVFHVLVIAAAVVHFVAIAGWVVPRGGY